MVVEVDRVGIDVFFGVIPVGGFVVGRFVAEVSVTRTKVVTIPVTVC